jgi:uncharacterized SAM-binding protein YcdF (DUF218 family)
VTGLDDVEASAAPVERRTSRRRWGRWVLLGAAGFVVLTVAYYLVTLFQVWSTANDDGAQPADAIVVLGAAQYDGRPAPVLASRLDHALALYQEGVADTIVVTGGKQPADRFTEAAASARYLEERGVPADAILQETTGQSSFVSLEAAARLLRSRGKERVVLVSDPYHSLRIRGIAEELGLDAMTSPTRTSPIEGGEAFRRMVKEAAGVALARLVGYERLERWNG